VNIPIIPLVNPSRKKSSLTPGLPGFGKTSFLNKFTRKMIDDKLAQNFLNPNMSIYFLVIFRKNHFFKAFTDMKELYERKENIIFLNKLISDEDSFISNITNMEYSSMLTFHDAVKLLIQDHKSLFYLVHQLKKLIKAANTMAESMVLGESMERIVNETCECLECDRASVFLVDYLKEELWSKVAKGSDITIRIPLKTGIVGKLIFI